MAISAQFRDAPRRAAGCWRRLNLFRRQANMDDWTTPEDAYPGTDPDQVRFEIPQAGSPCRLGGAAGKVG